MPFSDLLNWAKKHRLHVWAAEGCRTLLAATFLFSGLVKANDPVGLSIKLNEYARVAGWNHMYGTVLMGASMALALFEITLGVALAFGLNRRFTAVMTTVFMSVMTLLTVWLAVDDPIEDCGCFGDAVVLTNTQSLFKNVILLAASVLLARYSRWQHRLIPSDYSWLVSLPAVAGTLLFEVWNIKHLPLVDLRPYYVGADLRNERDAMTARPQFEVKIVYRRSGETLELEADDPDPDSSWHYVETRRIPQGTGTVAGLKTFLDHRADVADFSLTDSNGDELTDEILQDTGYVFLLSAPDLATADQGCVGNINLLYEDALAGGASFYCVTASGKRWQDYWTDHTGAEYPYLTADRQMLETLVRANPGLVLLHDGKIVAKWSNWLIPAAWRPSH